MIKILKKLKYHYEVLFNDEIYNIETLVIYKYQIKDGSEFSLEQFNKILKDNEFYYFDRFAKKKLSKLLTIKELNDILLKEGASDSLVQELVTNYISLNYLNDDYYVKSYLDFKGSKEGKQLIKKQLMRKGISEELIDNHLKLVNEDEKITNLISLRINKYPNLNKQQLTNKLISFLTNKGFDYYLVKNIVNLKLASITIDESKLIEKDYQKLVKRYSEDINKIKQKLYNKGYNLTLIEKIINK